MKLYFTSRRNSTSIEHEVPLRWGMKLYYVLVPIYLLIELFKNRAFGGGKGW